MSILACPKCHEPLEIEGKTCKCINNHCYDIARQGYMNLLLNPDKASPFLLDNLACSSFITGGKWM